MQAGSLVTKTLVLSAAAVIFALHAQAQQPVTSHDGSCQVTAPGNWQVSGSFGIATSPDKSMSIAVTSPRLSPALDSIKKNAPMIYPGDKVVKSTATEFQMEGENGAGKANVYRGIQLPGKVCLVEVDYAPGAIDEARKIAESLKSAK